MRHGVIVLLLLLMTATGAWADVKGLKVNGQAVAVGESFRVEINNVEADVILLSVDEKSFVISHPALFVASADEACSSSAGQKRTELTEGGMLIENGCDKSSLSMVVFKNFKVDGDGYLSVQMHEPQL